MHDLRGKAAVVTGASRGLGAAIAISLAEHGADVLITARGVNELADTATAIEKGTGRSPVVFEADIGVPDDIERLKSEAMAAFGPVGVLVNTAGIFGPLSTIANSEASAWIETLQTNTVGPYLTCRAFVGDMVEAGWGRIVNVSSSASLAPPTALNSAYATSKVALNHMTRHLAAEIEGTGVTANVVHPGSLKTGMYLDIKAKVAQITTGAEAFEAWVERVGSTGGDAVSDATDLVMALIDGEMSEVNGEFCWPARGWIEKRHSLPWTVSTLSREAVTSRG